MRPSTRGLFGLAAVFVAAVDAALAPHGFVLRQVHAALAAGHQAKGDTIETAAANSGLDAGKLQEIVAHIGGEGSLASFASMLGQSPDALQKVAGFLDRDGDGNPLNDIAGMAKGLFGS